MSTSSASTPNSIFSHATSPSSASSADRFEEDTEAGAVPWILYHILCPECAPEIPLTIMFSFNAGQKPKSVRDAHEWWQKDSDGRFLRETISSFEGAWSDEVPEPAPSARLDTIPETESVRPIHPYDRFAQPENDCLWRNLDYTDLEPEENKALLDIHLPKDTTPYTHALPYSFVRKHVLKCFTEDYEQANFATALHCLDYLRDLEFSRRAKLRDLGRQWGITTFNWQIIFSTNTMSLQWFTKMQKEEELIGKWFASLYVDLRIWIMINELKRPWTEGLPLREFKKEIMAMLNTLYPPTLLYVPNDYISIRQLQWHRKIIYGWIMALEQAKTPDTILDIERQVAQGKHHSWRAATLTLNNYLKHAHIHIHYASTNVALINPRPDGVRIPPINPPAIDFGSTDERCMCCAQEEAQPLVHPDDRNSRANLHNDTIKVRPSLQMTNTTTSSAPIPASSRFLARIIGTRTPSTAPIQSSTFSSRAANPKSAKTAAIFSTSSDRATQSKTTPSTTAIPFSTSSSRASPSAAAAPTSKMPTYVAFNRTRSSTFAGPPIATDFDTPDHHPDTSSSSTRQRAFQLHNYVLPNKSPIVSPRVSADQEDDRPTSSESEIRDFAYDNLEHRSLVPPPLNLSRRAASPLPLQHSFLGEDLYPSDPSPKSVRKTSSARSLRTRRSTTEKEEDDKDDSAINVSPAHAGFNYGDNDMAHTARKVRSLKTLAMKWKGSSIRHIEVKARSPLTVSFSSDDVDDENPRKRSGLGKLWERPGVKGLGILGIGEDGEEEREREDLVRFSGDHGEGAGVKKSTRLGKNKSTRAGTPQEEVPAASYMEPASPMSGKHKAFSLRGKKGMKELGKKAEDKIGGNGKQGGDMSP